jgi:aryl-alcohol dehydrogenase-like predicted oxidoreductase
MQRRALGTQGPLTPVVVFGAWAMGGGYWGARRDDEAAAALDAAFAGAMPAVDTAPIYGFGHSEELCGAALARARVRPLVFTKCGLRWDDPSDRGDLAFEGPGPQGRTVRVRRNSRPDSVRLECERSLARLGVERLDLLQVHWRDTTTPVAETMGELARLRAEGKIAAIGVSNFTVPELEEAQRALGDVPLASLQPRYSLVHRAPERDVLPWCADHGVGTLIYSPLEQGLLSGRVHDGREFASDDARGRRPSFRADNRARFNAALAAAVLPIAERLGATCSQVVLAWTLAQRGVTAVLAGCRTPAQVEENAGAARLALTPRDLETVSAAFAAPLVEP